MGIVKNLMVRVGVNAQGFVRGMKDATQAGKEFQSAGNGLQNSAKKYESPIKAASRAIRQHNEQLSASQRAAQGAGAQYTKVGQMLKESRQQMEGLQAAADGMDLRKPFAQQKSELEDQLDGINSRLEDLRTAMATSTNGIVQSQRGPPLHLDDAEAEFAALAQQSDTLAQKLIQLDQITDRLGDQAGIKSIKDVLKDASAQTDKLEQEAKATKQELKRLGNHSVALGSIPKASVAASAALKAAGNNAKSLWRGIKAIPGLFKKIGGSAGGSYNGVTKLLKGIKGLGVVSLGLRVASGLFGKLKSAVSSFTADNVAFNQAMVDTRYQVGQALLPIINGLTAALNAARPVLVAVASAISRVYAQVFGDIAKKANAAAEAVGGSIYGFDQITKVDANAVDPTVPEGADKFHGIAATIAGELGKIKSLVAGGDMAGLGELLAGYLNTAVAKLKKLDWGKKIVGILNKGIQLISGFIRGIGWKALALTLFTGLSAVLIGIDWGSLGELLRAAISGLLDILIGAVEGIDWAGILRSLTTGLGTLIASIDLGGLLLKIGELLIAIIREIPSLVQAAWAGLSDIAGGIWYALGVDWIGDLAGGLANAISSGNSLGEILHNVASFVRNSLVDGFTAARDAIVRVWHSLADALREPLNGVLRFINRLISGICDGINYVVRAINSLSFSLPDWAIFGDLAGATLGFALKEIASPQIPMLAEGGVVVRPTRVVIGEAGTEAVLPLQNHTGWAKDVAGLINRESTGGSQPIIVQIYLRGKMIAREVVGEINQITRSTGVCPIYL